MARILVVDDDLLTRDYIGHVLSAEGHSVEKAENGESGLAAFRARSADIVITDMVMPKADGVEFIAALLKESPKVPVIAMSGAPQSAQFLYLASYLGAGNVLTKPVAGEALIAAVNGLLMPRK